MRLGRASARTDTGRRRLQNEDAFVCEPPLFAIADGMGGAQAGEVASHLATTALRDLAATGASVPELIREANGRVWEHSLQDPAVAGMGTTVTLARVHEAEGIIEIGHVGDSRAYRIRDGRLEQLTPDHTLVAELVRSGRLTEQEAYTHPHKSVITRAVGTEPDVHVDAFAVETSPGDLFLLCSDGLTDMLHDADILAAVAAGAGDPAQSAESLVHGANAAGGVDNVTVVLFEIVEGDPEPRTMPVAADSTPPETPAPAAPPVRRHGAPAGGRWIALAVIAVALVLALALIWWGLAA
jgi:serine/threonine protein phosphatase PrpC